MQLELGNILEWTSCKPADRWKTSDKAEGEEAEKEEGEEERYKVEGNETDERIKEWKTDVQMERKTGEEKERRGCSEEKKSLRQGWMKGGRVRKHLTALRFCVVCFQSAEEEKASDRLDKSLITDFHLFHEVDVCDVSRCAEDQSFCLTLFSDQILLICPTVQY